MEITQDQYYRICIMKMFWADATQIEVHGRKLSLGSIELSDPKVQANLL